MLIEMTSPLDMDKIDNLFSGNSDNSIGERALLIKFMHYLEEEKDLNKAAQVYEEIMKYYPISNLDKFAYIGLYDSQDKAFKKNESEGQDQIPDEFKLNDAYPNPFNPETKISFGLPVESNVKIEIYNIIGQVIRKYELSSIEPGIHQLIWNGLNQQNISMPSGIYIIRFVAEPLEKSMNIFQKSIKVTLLR